MRLLLLFSLTVFLFLFVSLTSVLKSVPSGHPYGLLSSEPSSSEGGGCARSRSSTNSPQQNLLR